MSEARIAKSVGMRDGTRCEATSGRLLVAVLSSIRSLLPSSRPSLFVQSHLATFASSFTALFPLFFSSRSVLNSIRSASVMFLTVIAAAWATRTSSDQLSPTIRGKSCLQMSGLRGAGQGERGARSEATRIGVSVWDIRTLAHFAHLISPEAANA